MESMYWRGEGVRSRLAVAVGHVHLLHIQLLKLKLGQQLRFHVRDSNQQQARSHLKRK